MIILGLLTPNAPQTEFNKCSVCKIHMANNQGIFSYCVTNHEDSPGGLTKFERGYKDWVQDESEDIEKLLLEHDFTMQPAFT